MALITRTVCKERRVVDVLESVNFVVFITLYERNNTLKSTVYTAKVGLIKV